MRNFLAKIFGRQKYIDKKEQEEREAHIRSILNFTRPIDEKNVFGVVENFDEFDSVRGSVEKRLGGHLKKNFVKLHRGYFSELFSAIFRDYPNINYVTFLDEESIVKYGVAPENLSVLVKQMGLQEFRSGFDERKTMFSETVVSQVMNFFGAKTVFNKAIQREDDFYVLSVNFLKKGQTFFVADKLNHDLKIAGYQKIQDNLDAIDDKLDILKTIIKFEMKQKHPKIYADQIKEDFVYSYLIRTLLLGDRDFTDRNYGFVYDSEKNRVYSAPGFDFELSFAVKPEHTPFFERNMQYIFNNYHSVFCRFKRMLEEFTQIDKKSKKPIFELFIESEVGDKAVAFEMIDFLQETSKSLLLQIQKIEQSSKNAKNGKIYG